MEWGEFSFINSYGITQVIGIGLFLMENGNALILHI